MCSDTACRLLSQLMGSRLLPSALENRGIAEIELLISEYIQLTKENNSFENKRNAQNKFWLLATIDHQLKMSFYQNPLIKEAMSKEIHALENGKTTPFNAAKRLLDL